MQEDFKVSITGDVSGLKKAVGDAEKELSAFASKSRSLKTAIAENIAISRGYDQAINELKKSFKSGAISQTQFKEALVRLKRDEKETTIETSKLKNELINLHREAAGLPKIMPQVGNALKVVDKTGANASNTLLEFSRVVQDAPYGIRGVANNIQQLVGNFGYLSKAAGGSGAAFKAMASSLMGPAGILLAVSLVTSAFIQYGDQIANMIQGNGELAASQKKVNEALNDFYGGSVTKMNTYVSILENVNTTEAERKRITNELIELVPTLKKADFEYGNNLDIVKTKIGQYVLAQASRIEADTLVQENSEILAKKARILQIQSITDSKKRLEEFTKFLKEEGKSLETTKGIDATSMYMSGGGVGAGGRSARKKTAKEITDEFNKLASDLEVELKPIQDRITELYGITFSGEGGGKAEVDTTAFEELVAKQGEVKKALEDSILTKGADADATRKLKTEYFNLSQQIQAVRDAIDGKAKPIRLPATIDFEVSKTGFQQLEQTFKDKFGRPIPSDQFKLLDNLPIVVGEMNSEIARLIGNIENMLPTDIWGNLNVPPDLFSNLNKMSAEELTIFRNNLDKTIMASSILNEAVSSSFTALGNSIAGSLKTDSELVNAFVGSIIGSMSELLTALITTAITNLAIKEAVATGNAVTAATESAVATGPAAAWVLPALIAGTVAMVAGAFASIGGFAGGGIVPGGSFNGDKKMAFVNSGEMILNAGQQSNLFDILDGNLRKLGGQQQMQTVNVQGELRGQTILLANKRAEKNTNRFYGRR